MSNFRYIFSTLVVLCSLSACGGGGGGEADDSKPDTPPPAVPVTPPPPSPPVATLDSISGTIASDVAFLAMNTVNGGVISVGTGGGTRITGAGSAIEALVVDQLVFIPSDAAAGMPVGFAGRVVSRIVAGGTTTLELIPAQVEDMFTDLDWNLDTSRTGARVVAVIGPNGQLITPATAQATRLLSASNSQLGTRATAGESRLLSAVTNSGTLKVGDKGIEGELSFGYPFKSGDEALQLVVQVNVKELKVRSEGKFDKVKFASSGGWLKLGAVVSGKLGGTVAVKAERPTTIDLGSALYAAAIWKDLKMTLPRMFEWDGLGDSDKKGKIPIAGIVLQPATPPQPFKGEGITRAKLDLLSVSSATIIWIYSDANGSLSMEGEVGVRIDDVAVEAGMELRIDGANPTLTPTGKLSTAKAELYGTGKAEFKQRLGMSVAADVLMAGVRPLTVGVFAGVDTNGQFKGENASVELYPQVGKVEGPWGCFEQTLWGGVQASAAMRFQAAKFPTSALLSPQWRQKGPSKQKTYEMQWDSGKLATFYDSKMNKQFSAVCSGEMEPAPMAIADGASKRMDIIDTDSKLARNTLNATPLPAALEWVSNDPSLLRVVPGADGAMLTGLKSGAAVLKVTDPRTKWTRSVIVQVGLTCRQEVKNEFVEGKPRESAFTLCENDAGRVLLAHERQSNFAADGKRIPIFYGTNILFSDLFSIGVQFAGYWTPTSIFKTTIVPPGVGGSLVGTLTQGDFDSRSNLRAMYFVPIDINSNWLYPQDIYSCSTGDRRHTRATSAGLAGTTSTPLTEAQCPTLEQIKAVNGLTLQSNPYYQTDKADGVAPVNWEN